MTKLWLHIGHGKTGTSFLQYAWVKHRCDLAEKGIIYPESSNDAKVLTGEATTGNGSELATALVNFGQKRNLTQALRSLETVVRSTKEDDNILLSSELFCWAPTASWQILHRCQDLLGIEVAVIYVVRSLAELAFSSWSQRVKRRGNQYDFDRWCRTWKAQYRRHIEAIEDGLGAEVHVLNYDRERQRLLAVIHATMGINPVVLSSPATVNRSLSARELALMMALNKALWQRLGKFPGAMAMPVSDRFVAEHPNTPACRPAWDAKQLNRIYQNNQGDLDYVNRRFLSGREIALSLSPPASSGELLLPEVSNAEHALVDQLAHRLARRADRTQIDALATKLITHNDSPPTAGNAGTPPAYGQDGRAPRK